MKPETIKMGATVSIVGALFALILLAIEAGEKQDIASMLSLLTIMVLFFASAGLFFDNGTNLTQMTNLAVVGINAAVILSTFFVFNAFSVWVLIIFVVFAIIIGLAASSEQTSRWMSTNKI